MVAMKDGIRVMHCTKCRYVLCSAKERWKDNVPRLDSLLSKAGTLRSTTGRFKMREYLCPRCGTTLDVEVAQDGDPPLYDEVEVDTIPKEYLRTLE